METYIDFLVSYLIQTFENKINTKLWNDYCVILHHPEFQIFRKNILHFRKRATICCSNRGSGDYPLNQGHMTQLPLSLNKWFYTPAPLPQASARHCFLSTWLKQTRLKNLLIQNFSVILYLLLTNLQVTQYLSDLIRRFVTLGYFWLSRKIFLAKHLQLT